ncbi:rho GTPase-activating protein 18 [Caerostris darwini]|uniref:Rho GTPase-activating protein 18 n=1 Tax=Caerostris darwini TaxID=1538125 RepID=A0AAV4VGL0_9ARAC|nr:rho GTPase-activating protein 18 [Caerostris darwini]
MKISRDRNLPSIPGEGPSGNGAGDIDKDLAALQRNSNVQIGDLGENDRNLVRSLANIEVAALLDAYGLVPTRRPKPNRKKEKGRDLLLFLNKN